MSSRNETPKKISLDQILEFRRSLYERSMRLVRQKGSDYNRQQQQDGDTLFNLRTAVILGIVETETQSVLVRLLDKMMRMISLCKDPQAVAAVKDESVLDTIADVHNYVDYLGAFWLEARGELGKFLEPTESIRKPAAYPPSIIGVLRSDLGLPPLNSDERIIAENIREAENDCRVGLKRSPPLHPGPIKRGGPLEDDAGWSSFEPEPIFDPIAAGA